MVGFKHVCHGINRQNVPEMRKVRQKTRKSKVRVPNGAREFTGAPGTWSVVHAIAREGHRKRRNRMEKLGRWNQPRRETLLVQGRGGRGVVCKEPLSTKVQKFEPLELGHQGVVSEQGWEGLPKKEKVIGREQGGSPTSELILDEIIKNSVLAKGCRVGGMVKNEVTVVPHVPSHLHELTEPRNSPPSGGLMRTNRSKVLLLKELPAVIGKTI